MQFKINKGIRIIIAAALCLSLTAGLVPVGTGWAGVRYMPDVTAAMSQADYWASKVGDPDRVQATVEEIEQLNQDIWEKSLETRDLANWSRTEYDAVQTVKDLLSGAQSDADYCYSVGAQYDQNGNWQDKDTLYNSRIAMCADATVDIESTEPDMRPYQYAVCTTRSTLLVFPTAERLLDDPSDPDYDVNYLSIVRVNEPLILTTASADGQYYAAMNSGCAGWIKATDVAICESKQEWLEAWNYPSEQLLVVYDDKIYTEDSNFQPETANRKLPMGTCLQLASDDEIQGRISNRTAHNNHVVWKPVRRGDGTFEKKLALIGENRKVSEGYLPMTTRNVLKVALNQLGDAYGWGGMMGTNDCSGYVRDVYRCFGVDMPRSSNRNNGVALSYSLAGLSDAEKTAFIKRLPPGSQLSFTGHEMLYLGYEGDKLYVISSVSNLRIPGEDSVTRVRGGVINTLDMQRRDKSTWLQNLNSAEVPYYSSSHADPQVSLAAASVTDISSKTYTGEALTQEPTVKVNGTLLTAGQDYTISYENNINAGTASMVISGTGVYRDSVEATFSIGKAANPLTVKGKTAKLKYKKVKKKKRSLAAARVISFTAKGQGAVTYTKASGNKKIKINKKTGKVTVKKRLRKGTYKVKVRVNAAGNENYKAASRTVTFKIKVK